MSLDIAAALRKEANRAAELVTKLKDAGTQQTLSDILVKLRQLADRLERDARD
jgi:hypothetical protein